MLSPMVRPPVFGSIGAAFILRHAHALTLFSNSLDQFSESVGGYHGLFDTHRMTKINVEFFCFQSRFYSKNWVLLHSEWHRARVAVLGHDRHDRSVYRIGGV